MEPEPKTPEPPEEPKESVPPIPLEPNAVQEGALPSGFTEEQQQYISGFIAGMNAGLTVLGKKPIMDHPEEEKK